MNKKSNNWLLPLAAGLTALTALVGSLLVIPQVVKPQPAPAMKVEKALDAEATFKISGNATLELLPDSGDKHLIAIKRTETGAEAIILWNKDGVAAGGPAYRFVTVKGKMHSFARTFDGNRGVHYEVTYATDGVKIAQMRTFREDGSLAEVYEPLSDGGNRKRIYDSASALVREVSTDAAGTITTSEFAPGKPEAVSVSSSPAVSNTVEFGDKVTLPDGSSKPVLTVTTIAGKVVGWQWYRADGKVRQVGSITHEKMVVSYYSEGKRRLVETYRPKIEDWNRTYYRLESAELFFMGNDQVLDRGYYLRPNGKMERIEDGMMTGRKNWVQFFDENGKMLRQRSFKGDGNEFTDTDKSASGEVGSISSYHSSTQLTVGPTFRTEGEPFRDAPSLEGSLKSFFIEPGKELKEAPSTYMGHSE